MAKEERAWVGPLTGKRRYLSQTTPEAQVDQSESASGVSDSGSVPETVSVREAALLLKTSTKVIRGMIAREELQATKEPGKFGEEWRIATATLSRIAPMSAAAYDTRMPEDSDSRDAVIAQLQEQVADLRRQVEAQERIQNDLMERWQTEQAILQRALLASNPISQPAPHVKNPTQQPEQKRSNRWAYLMLIPVAAGIWYGSTLVPGRYFKIAAPSATSIKQAPLKKELKPAVLPEKKNPIQAPSPAKPPMAGVSSPSKPKTPATPPKAAAPAIIAKPAPAPIKPVAEPIIYVVRGNNRYHATKCWVLGQKRMTRMTLGEAKAKGYKTCVYCGNRVGVNR